MIEATGRLGATVTFDGTTVVIHRRPFRGSLVGTGEQTIGINQLDAIQFKPANFLTREGFIRFLTAGTTTPPSRAGQQNNAARSDPWAVMFWRKEQETFEQLRDEIQRALARRHGGAHDAPRLSAAEQLVKLIGLHAQGHLTDAEFKSLKQKLMND